MKWSPRTAILIAAVCAFGSAAFAQSSVKPAAKRDAKGSSIAEEERSRFDQCMKDWDAKTHMTKRDWERTCRRVTDERMKYLRENGYTLDNAKPASKAKN